MEKILILGGLGFIGSNFAKKCLEMGMYVTIYDNLDPNSGGNLFNIDPFKKHVELIVGDIINFEHLVQIVMDKDIIINCAASTSHPYSMREPWLNLDVNGRGVINILESIKRVNRNARFIHVGTTTQLGPLHYQPADEYHPEFPTDMYSANKTAAEKYVLLYSKAYGLKASVIRLPNVFGPRSAIHSADFTFNNFFIGLALQKKSITVYRPGVQLRNVLYVDDAVDALIAVTEADGAAGETFFAVGDEHYSVKYIAEKTSQIMGGSVHLIDWPKERQAIEIGDAVISNEKIKRALGWLPRVDLEYGLKLTYEYYKDKLGEYLK
ncbi:MAG: NAD(P)-dependent oxidoreductase [Bacteroidetes bacterium]|nr:NAD(P)-dependent oxidoreductase [Bacteroidota bacterium]